MLLLPSGVSKCVISLTGGVSTLEIPVFQQSGVYQCEVTNIYGSDNAAVVLCGTGEGEGRMLYM